MKENRNLLIGIVLGALMAGALSFLFLNELVKAQTQYQQLHIAQQAELIESIRKSGLLNLMSNVLDKIDDELKNNPKRMLSDETIARITALSYSFKPYTHFEGDSLSEKKLSPERGQLLLVLSRMNIDSGSLHKIMFQASFSGADLREVDLRGADLRGTDLRGADLQDANLQGTKFNEADLRSANLWGANLSKANLDSADLKRADLRWADLNGADLRRANLNGANLTSAQLRRTNLRGAVIQWADVSGAFLNEANLDSADLTGTSLQRAHLADSDLSKANLTMANLTEANLTGANLTGAELSRAIVSEENWLILLNEWLVTGAKEIQSRYKMTDDHSNHPSQYRLEKIEELNSKAKK